MARRAITINGKRHLVDVADDMPLLWLLRDVLGLTGTKYGCGVGQCGACTVLQDGAAVRSCLVTVGEAAGKAYTTIEGLSADASHPIQRAWLDEDVAQCGYCQPGMMMELAALVSRPAAPSATEVDRALSDHVCRCGSYPRIRRAALRVARSGGGR